MQELGIDLELDEEELEKSREELRQVMRRAVKMTAEQFSKFSEDINEIIEKYPALVDIEFLKSILPPNFYIVNNKLANEMTKNFLNEGEVKLVVAKTPKKGEIITYNTLNFVYEDENIHITRKDEFTAYDRTVHNAVCSLYVAGNTVITSAMVYRAMNGMTETEYVSPKALETVRNSLDKSRFLRLRVDYTEELKAKGHKIDKTMVEGYLLNAEKIIIRSGNDMVEAYKIFRAPMLYQYASLTRQILSVPSKLLDTKDATRSTEDIIPIKEYLIRRIEIMKYDRTMSNKIVYDTIFKEAGIEIATKQHRERVRNYIKEILHLWKTRDKYIWDFKEYKERNAIKGIEIETSQKRY